MHRSHHCSRHNYCLTSQIFQIKSFSFYPKRQDSHWMVIHLVCRTVIWFTTACFLALKKSFFTFPLQLTQISPTSFPRLLPWRFGKAPGTRLIFYWTPSCVIFGFVRQSFRVHIMVACEASIPERCERNSGRAKEAARKMGRQQKGGRSGVGEGKEGNACPQTPRFWKTVCPRTGLLIGGAWLFWLTSVSCSLEWFQK